MRRDHSGRRLSRPLDARPHAGRPATTATRLDAQRFRFGTNNAERPPSLAREVAPNGASGAPGSAVEEGPWGLHELVSILLVEDADHAPLSIAGY